MEDPGAGAVLPTLQAAQAVGEKAPVPFQALPAGQSLQNVDPSPLEYVPGAQEVQLEAGEVPPNPARKVPGGQNSVHSCAPGVGARVPGAHRRHLGAPARGMEDPGAQGVGEEEPGGQKKPGGQMTCVGLVEPGGQ